MVYLSESPECSGHLGPGQLWLDGGFGKQRLKKPISGPVINGSDYFKGTVKEHAVGILGGIIWSIGMSFSILASGPAGYAISYGLGQGATMIAVIWGVFVWREFASAPAGTNKLINAMFAFYILGIALIIAANSI
ncbi:hypothetical protein RY972_04760 [Aeromonas allosaccharophila]|uniref:Multidrug DMT transporter permease n=1 Tax=Aeromonas allosaccharophila TaxID=656 RepID=A0ABZ0FD84_9GAMM|nr:hypothetical protein [Aeromonas allosaccharophila]WOE67400.1 hypothetical protein RY972_04760 [Aeromonas allosaccharophila]